MKYARSTALFLLLALLAGCAKPLPEHRRDYVGHWQGPGADLLILADGSLVWKRIKGGASTSIQASIQKFEGDDFFVGAGPFSTRFDVSEPPHTVQDQWRMTVDGVELTRTDKSAESMPGDSAPLISA